MVGQQGQNRGPASGFRLMPGHLSVESQAELVAEAFRAADHSPFYRPIVPGGRRMSVEMTNLGAVGWVSDPTGYRYAARHPVTARPWAAIPALLIDLWREVTGAAHDPDCCLVNLYRDGARMGLHQDRDEADFSFPVLSVSLGDTAVFRLGGVTRGSPTRGLRLASGDVCVLEGAGRLVFHGIDRVLEGSSRLIPGGGRLNLTLRRARPAVAVF